MDDSDENDFSEIERERKRELRSNYVKSGIPMSRKHDKWRKGRRDAEAAGASKRAEMNGESKASNPAPVSEFEKQTAATNINASLDKKTPARRTIQMYSETRREWHPLEATFDTGTPENWISSNMIVQLEYPVEVVANSTYYTFTGEILESSEVIHQVRWCIDNGSGPATRSRYTSFRVAPAGAPFVVLFGRDLIFSEDIFSFNEANLILTKVGENAEKKAREDKKKQVDAEAETLAKERQSSGTRTGPPSGPGSPLKKPSNGAS